MSHSSEAQLLCDINRNLMLLNSAVLDDVNDIYYYCFMVNKERCIYCEELAILNVCV